MGPWNTSGGSTVSRDEAITKITAMAKDKGYKGAFKVFYDGELIADPDDLPDEVEMGKVKLSAVLDQA